MMDQENDFREHMRLAMDSGKPTGACFTERDLLVHLRGETDASARERVESHLVRCERCRERFLELEDFFGPLREGEPQPTEFDTARAWTRLSQRIRSHGRVSRTAIFTRKHLWPSVPLAVAAGLVLTIGLVGGWSLRYLRDRTTFEAFRAQSASENRRLQQRAETMQQQLAKLQQPQINGPIFDVYPNQSLARSPGIRKNQVEIPVNTAVTLILNGQGQRRFTSYSLAIVDRQGRELWHADGLTRGADGNFGIVLRSGFLPDGEYQFRIFGKTAAGSEQVAGYAVTLQTSAANAGNAR